MATKTPKTADEQADDQIEALQEESLEDKDAKCDNHPGRKAHTFTGGGAFELHLCDECTPPWFKADE